MSSDEPPTSAQVDPPPVPQQLPTTDTVPEKTVDGQDGDGITKKDFATTADGPDRPEDNSGKVDKDYAPPSLLVHASTNISSISDGFSESRSTQGTPTSSSNGSPHVPKPVGLPESSKLPTGATSVPQTPSTVGTKRTSSGAVKLSGGSSSLPNSPTSEQVSTTVPESLNGVTSTPANPDRIQDLSSALRARLTYALVKVQNGWQSHSLSEVENICSNQASPITLKSPLSPSIRARFRLGDMNLRSPNPQANRASPGPRRTFAALEIGPELSSPPQPPKEESMERSLDILANAGEARGRTYESFWKEHPPSTTRLQPSQGSIHAPQLYRNDSSSSVGSSHMAGDFAQVPSSNTHLMVPGQMPGQVPAHAPTYVAPTPSLRHNDSNMSNISSVSNYSYTSIVPESPGRETNPTNPIITTTTTSDDSKLERDAVESLMFLSSPNGSQSTSTVVNRRSLLGMVNMGSGNPPLSSYEDEEEQRRINGIKAKIRRNSDARDGIERVRKMMKVGDRGVRAGVRN